MKKWSDVTPYGLIDKSLPLRRPLTPLDVLRAAAAAWEGDKAGLSSSRPLSEDYELIGLVGADTFGAYFGLPTDIVVRPKRGDGGVDFWANGFAIDVKTARLAFNLIVERGKNVSDIYVLARYMDETQSVELCGWAWGEEVATWPVRDFGYGIKNHFKPVTALHPIAELFGVLETPRPRSLGCGICEGLNPNCKTCDGKSVPQ